MRGPRLTVRLASLLPGVFLCLCACSTSSHGKPAGADASTDTMAPSDAAPPDAGPTTHANGTAGSWSTLAPMPLPRANHCSVAASGYLVILGGNYMPDGGTGFVNTDAVHVAALHSDGSLGAWAQAGTTPSPVNSCTATASGSTIYLLDGIYDDMTKGQQVWSADLSSAGVLGAWTSRGPLPAGKDILYSDAWVGTDSASTLYAMDAQLTGGVAALHVALAPAFGTWAEDDWLPEFLGHPEYAFTGAYVYALGGYTADDAGDNPVLTSTNGAPIGSDGKVGTAFATTPIPAPTAFGKAAAVDDWIFLVGGKSSVFGSGVPDVYSAKVASAGQLGAWGKQPSLPEGRTDMAMTLAGDFLYLSGGGFDGPGVDSVYAARVRF
jgi:hypothetical protein